MRKPVRKTKFKKRIKLQAEAELLRQGLLVCQRIKGERADVKKYKKLK